MSRKYTFTHPDEQWIAADHQDLPHLFVESTDKGLIKTQNGERQCSAAGNVIVFDKQGKNADLVFHRVLIMQSVLRSKITRGRLVPGVLKMMTAKNGNDYWDLKRVSKAQEANMMAWLEAGGLDRLEAKQAVPEVERPGTPGTQDNTPEPQPQPETVPEVERSGTPEESKHKLTTDGSDFVLPDHVPF